MSHIKRAKTQIKLAEHIPTAVQRLAERMKVNLPILQNAQPRGFAGKRYQECEFVVQLPGSYDLGIHKSKTGDTYEFIADSELLNAHTSRGKDAAIIGRGGSELYKEYIIAAATAQAELAGHTVESVNYLESGAVEVLIDVPELEGALLI